MEIEDTGERLRGATVFLFNLPQYALGLPIASDGSAEDGLLDLCVFERPGVFWQMRYVAAVLRRTHCTLPDFHYRRVRRVRLFSNTQAPVQIDGDPAGCLPATIEVVPGALALVVPATAS